MDRTRGYFGSSSTDGTSASVKSGYPGSSTRREEPDLRKFERVVNHVKGNAAEGSKDRGGEIDRSSDHGLRADDRTPMERFLQSTSWMDKFFQEQRTYVVP